MTSYSAKDFDLRRNQYRTTHINIIHEILLGLEAPRRFCECDFALFFLFFLDFLFRAKFHALCHL